MERRMIAMKGMMKSVWGYLLVLAVSAGIVMVNNNGMFQGIWGTAITLAVLLVVVGVIVHEVTLASDEENTWTTRH
jgi:hypothetical protein